MNLVDTHCHLFYDDLKNDLDGVLARANELGVNTFICVGTNMDDSRECLSLSETHENIYASAGVHPHDAKDAPEDYVDQIYDLLTFDSMVAVGEMGLDYFRNISWKIENSLDWRGFFLASTFVVDCKKIS